MVELARMKEALTHLVRNVMDAIPGCGKFSLAINQFNYEIESLLKCDDSIIGACAFIYLAGGGVVEQIKEKIIKPFFTVKTYGKDLGLAIAYRIIKQHHGRIKVESRVRQGEEANIYLPLTKWEIVHMMSIPAG